MLKFGFHYSATTFKASKHDQTEIKKKILKSEYGFTVMFIDYVHNMIHV